MSITTEFAMSLATFRQFLGAVMAGIAMTMGTGTAEAGWLTIKNNTHRPILIQETTLVNGKIKHGRPVSLLPGETIREFIPGPTTKSLDIFDPQKPRQALWTGRLPCPEESQTYSVSGMAERVVVRPLRPLSPHK